MSKLNRAKAADTCLSILDTAFFKALCEPSRIDVICAMIKLGEADIGEIAEETPLDRSVVSRHLQMLEEVGVAVSHKDGRRVLYELDGPAVMEKFQKTIAAIEPLVPLCCPNSVQRD